MAGRIKEYWVLRSIGSEHIALKVQEAINNGWQPLGGVSVSDDYCYQAVVKYEGVAQ